MGARSELSTAVDVLAKNPVILVVAFAIILVSSAASAIQFAVPTVLVAVASLVTTGIAFFVSPFFDAGLLGMAEEGLSGRTSLDTFPGEARSNYLGLLAGRLLLVGALLAAYLAVIVLVLIVVFAFGAIGVAGGGMDGVGMMLAVVGLLFLLAGLVVVLTPVFFFQFFEPAIVVGDRGVVAAFKESYRLVRHNLVSVLGFDVIIIVLSLVAMLPTIGLIAVRFPAFSNPATGFSMYAGTPPTVVAGFVVATIAFGVPTVAFFRTYQVAYFVDLTADEP